MIVPILSAVVYTVVFPLPTGPTGPAHRGRATVYFGFLHNGEPAATWLWTGAVWVHVAGEGFLTQRQITCKLSVVYGVVFNCVS